MGGKGLKPKISVLRGSQEKQRDQLGKFKQRATAVWQQIVQPICNSPGFKKSAQQGLRYTPTAYFYAEDSSYSLLAIQLGVPVKAYWPRR